jgi:hypothetical protein
MTPTVENVLSIYRRSTPADMEEGMQWYRMAHKWAVDHTHGRTHLAMRNAGIVAALSPMNEWKNNKRKAEEVISKRGRITVVKGQPNGIGLGDNVVKACRIYKGEDPLDVLKGDKVRAFYQTILDPEGDFDPVVDRHAFDIAVGMRTDNKARSALQRKGVYEAFANIYREAARQANIGAAEMQATTWVAWKRIHNIAV